ncbi:hypothetical protein [Dyadobacter sp. 32]|uniref:hypothetical protein n=1 Tax=Dyadobacter sp. 32 TaxID=538966 RepID=UPI0011F036FF
MAVTLIRNWKTSSRSCAKKTSGHGGMPPKSPLQRSKRQSSHDVPAANPHPGQFRKRQKTERRSIPQELATHLSDTVDYYLCTKYGARAGRMAMGNSVIPAVGFFG